MPLSEHEQRILAEIERRLAEEDPRFVQRTRKAGGSDEDRFRLLRWAVAGFLLGLVSLFGLTFHFAFGVVGFTLMLLSVVTAIRVVRELDEAATQRIRDVFQRRDHAS